MCKIKNFNPKLLLLLIALTSIFWPSIKTNTDFSLDFLQGLLKNKKPEQQINPSIGSLEHDWLTINDEESDQCAQDSRHYELYLKTEYELASNRSKKASSVSKVLIDSNPPLPAHVARARLLFEEGKFFELIQLPFFSEISKSADWETVLMGAKAYEMVGMLSKAEQLFDQAMEKHADKDQVVYHRIMYAIKQGHNVKALKAIENFLTASNPKARHSIFYQLKAAIKLQESTPDLNSALTAINKSIELNPRSEKGFKMKIVVLEQLRKNKQHVDQKDLIQTYKQACTLIDDQNLKKILIDKLFKLGCFEPAYQELETLNETTPEHFFDLALLAFKAENLEQALAQVEKTLKKEPNFLKGLLLKLEILSINNPQAATAFAIAWFKNKNEQSVARKALLHLLKTEKNNSLILTALENDFNKNSKNLETLAAFADANFLTGNYEEAVKLYESLAQKISNDCHSVGLKTRLIYNISAANFLAGAHEKSFAQLKTILPQGDTMPEIYNLAAILNMNKTINNTTLIALNFAIKAVRLAPTNACFLDTLQHIFVHSGKLSQAFKVYFVTKLFDPLGQKQSSNFFSFLPQALGN